MTIHDMLNSAATDIRAMEIKIQTLEQQVEATERDNVRLRDALAKSDTARVHAQADLIHYQNVFKAATCVEAMKMCQKFFEVTHRGMMEEAETAVERIVEERVEAQREEAATKPASDIDEDKPFQESVYEFEHASQQAPAKNPSIPQDGDLKQAPKGMPLKDTKQFYRQHIGFVPSNYMQLPLFMYSAVDGKWFQQAAKFTNQDDGKPIPSFLSNPEPRTDTRGGVSRAVLAVFGG